MPKFSKESLELLSHVDKRLQDVFKAVVEIADCKVLESTIRTKEQQAEFVKQGVSKTMDSKHLTGHAVDIMPYPVEWPDESGISKEESLYRWKRIHVFAGIVIGTAAAMGVPLTWGGDWDGDADYRDQKFHDLPHFELNVQ